MTIKIPVKLISEANAREHWAVKNKRKKQQQNIVLMFRQKLLMERPEGEPLTVHLTRIGPRCLDLDNLAGCFKAAQDAIALVLGVDDGDRKRVHWTYNWRKGKPKEFALEVAFEGPGG